MIGNIFVISAPSGAGKTTVIKKLLEKIPNLTLSVSYTTRDCRPNEKDGVDYVFIPEVEFEKMIKSFKFVEWAEVHGMYYGTPKSEVDRIIGEGSDLLLDIDTIGAAKVREKYPEAISIFLLPPSIDELKKRLIDRGANKGKDLEIRLKNAKEEMAKRHEYDYQVFNEVVDEAIDEVADIIENAREEL